METWNNLGWLKICLKTKAKKTGHQSQIHLVGREQKVPSSLSKQLSATDRKRLDEPSTLEIFQGKMGKIYVVRALTVSNSQHNGLFTPSPFAMARDLVGTCLRQVLGHPTSQLDVFYHGESDEELKGLCVGLEMSQYRFKDVWPAQKFPVFPITINSTLKNHKTVLKEGLTLGEGTNLARFLVDLPGNALNPSTYAQGLQSHFAKLKKTKVQVWNESRLKKERMGLHVAVGQGAAHKSAMVHIEYRGGAKSPVVAIVGKGITFDSGGLDIKPSQGMRLMKKDMGGSAAVAGLAHYVIQNELPINCDFYFALAENAVAQDSFRPGDILTARSGQTVEIHNTDAEGRLVLADVITVAKEKKPSLLIDVATLTGAIKMGLGASVPGLFSNSDNLAESLLKAGQASGDLAWRMPLIPQERGRLKSDVADLVNCTEGFGGAVTAALFLENFVGDIPWAHFDIYAWVDRPTGLYAASGGSGQMVQCLGEFLKSWSE